MTGFRGSASRTDREPTLSRVLICGVNWVGDTIMSMPAVQAFHADHPETRIEMLVKPGMAPVENCRPPCCEIGFCPISRTRSSIAWGMVRCSTSERGRWWCPPTPSW